MWVFFHKSPSLHSFRPSRLSAQDVQRILNKTYFCSPQHQRNFGSHRVSQMVNQTKVCMCVHVCVCAGFIGHVCLESPNFPSPSISWRAVHLLAFSGGACEILIRKKSSFQEAKADEDALQAAECGTPEC